MLSHPGLQVQQPAEHRFDGDVYILTNGWTFSTAADVATVAHHNGLATFIGEETGGGYDGNTSGDSSGIGLPSAKFTGRVQKWMYTTANVGHEFPGRGVIPHHHVRPDVQDTLAGRDVELEKAVELMASKSGGR
jgi:C-terminal processing protease CtpA/Prc